ncbi:MAG: 3-oxoacyl-[acyl-carrier-protein] synthase [Thermoleophilaceae bacterium]|jgi:3-oxoacyl-[acyl-carrier-protein] synthase-3|nr:3-oxoacyl-[acyl-carrier-protein] synthase [Thermoleophilaceae bacterium]
MRSAVVETGPAPLWRNGQTRGATIASVAMAVPDNVVTNATVAEGAGVTEQWIVHRTGVHERRHVAGGERLQDLATAAGRQALEEAGVAAEDVDLVLVATVGADELLPNAAPLVALDLGADKAGAMDLGAACTGFLSALSLAAAQVECGRCENVLVIGADVLSRFTDKSDRGTAALFADGAGAVVVGAANGGPGLIGHIALHADGAGAAAICATHDDQIIHMQGHDTFKAAVHRLSESTLEAVDRVGLQLDDIGLFVYHQANARILAAVGERLAVDGARVIDCIDRYGNTSSATLPIALADARERGMLEPGMNVLLAAFGAGFTWGAGVIQWGA